MWGILSSIETLMDAGGAVLWAIMLLSVALWCLIVDRFLYLHVSFPETRLRWLSDWRAISDKHSWQARRIRACYLSEAKLELGRNLGLIKTLIALCPLLGLLGTVTGMIQTFDVMAVVGSGNARAMATGVSSAILTTMAGMVIAISSLYFSKLIEDRADFHSRQLLESLTYED